MNIAEIENQVDNLSSEKKLCLAYSILEKVELTDEILAEIEKRAEESLSGSVPVITSEVFSLKLKAAQNL